MVAETLAYELPWWLFLILIWELIWKAIGMWRSARNNQTNWFIFLLVVNSAGILPMVYLRFFQRNRNVGAIERRKGKKR